MATARQAKAGIHLESKDTLGIHIGVYPAAAGGNEIAEPHCAASLVEIIMNAYLRHGKNFAVGEVDKHAFDGNIDGILQVNFTADTKTKTKWR